MSSLQIWRGTQPHAALQDPSTSPAEAFFHAFRDATRGVRFGALEDEPGDLAMVAGAFREAQLRAAEWVRQRLGWHAGPARALGQALALVAGDWLESAGGDLEALRGRLQQAWRDCPEVPGE